MPALKHIGITVDCPDADQLAEFWERCLGYARRPGAPGGPYVTLERVDGSPDGPPVVTFQSVPEPKTSKARIHLDLFVDEAQPLVDEMRAAGASLVSCTEAGEWTTRVLQDPAGNEFCIIGPD
jgi:glyoxalase superfamily protein